jgi:hypothetical protein
MIMVMTTMTVVTMMMMVVTTIAMPMVRRDAVKNELIRRQKSAMRRAARPSRAG